MKTLILQHEFSTTPGSTIKWHEQNHVEYKIHFFSESTQEPDLNSFDNLVICGGGMNVDQEAEFPWLKNEKEFIRKCITANKKIVGLCLGGQLLADILGGKVFKADHWELGWHDIQLESEVIKGLHWHGQQFIAPKDAYVFAKNEACPNQAFTFGQNILATQFHPEADQFWVEYNVENSKMPGPSTYVQDKDTVLNGLKYQASLENWYFKSLDKILKK